MLIVGCSGAFLLFKNIYQMIGTNNLLKSDLCLELGTVCHCVLTQPVYLLISAQLICFTLFRYLDEEKKSKVKLNSNS